MDVREPLLLSEGVCWQLGIIVYHPNVLRPAELSKGPGVGEVVKNRNNSGAREENSGVKTQNNSGATEKIILQSQVKLDKAGEENHRPTVTS